MIHLLEGAWVVSMTVILVAIVLGVLERWATRAIDDDFEDLT